MWEKVKEHPWIVGGAIGLLLLVLVFSSSSSSTAGSAPATSDGSGNSSADYQAGLNAQTGIANINAGVQSQQIAGAVTVAQLQAGTADNANTLAAQVAEFTSKLSADVAMNHDTLSAQVAQNNNATQLGIVNSNNLANTTNTATLTNALVHSQDLAAQTSMAIAGINSNTLIQTNAQNANAMIQTNSQNTNRDIQLSEINAGTQDTLIKSYADIIGAKSAGLIGVANAQRPCSSYLFGLISNC